MKMCNFFHKIFLFRLKYRFKVDKKRHLGNDIVAIIFQDSNTPFCPTLMKTKVTHSYVVVQPMDIDGPTQYKVRFGSRMKYPTRRYMAHGIVYAL